MMLVAQEAVASAAYRISFVSAFSWSLSRYLLSVWVALHGVPHATTTDCPKAWACCNILSAVQVAC